jgi:hypothetical protein
VDIGVCAMANGRAASNTAAVPIYAEHRIMPIGKLLVGDRGACQAGSDVDVRLITCSARRPRMDV